jgi:CDP-diacylglycerol--glycerol-3-phosphate 3-phosphatidyltransferase
MKQSRWIANALTVSRIILSLLLLFLVPLGTAFLTVYAVCGVTDILDGFIARKMHAQSNLGAKLDSIADFVLAAAMIIVLYPMIILVPGAFVWIVFIAAIRIVSALVAYVKYKAFASLHTYANKLTGLLIFLFPFFMDRYALAAHVWILCGVATLSAMEELIIQIRSTKLNLDRKSIFSKE